MSTHTKKNPTQNHITPLKKHFCFLCYKILKPARSYIVTTCRFLLLCVSLLLQAFYIHMPLYQLKFYSGPGTRPEHVTLWHTEDLHHFTELLFHFPFFKGSVKQGQTNGVPVGTAPVHLVPVNAPMRNRWDWVTVCVVNDFLCSCLSVFLHTDLSSWAHAQLFKTGNV